jgi:predicted GNAT family acetyltransferase
VATSVVDVPDRMRFEVRVDGEVAGFAEYRRRPGLIAFIHTMIDPRFEGHGLGSKLVRTALDQARQDGVAVLPFCPFVRGYIAGHGEYVDLVPNDLRAKLRADRRSCGGITRRLRRPGNPRLPVLKLLARLTAWNLLPQTGGARRSSTCGPAGACAPRAIARAAA